MKKVIPYIASEYKRDKIWMRRKKPEKRLFDLTIASLTPLLISSFSRFRNYQILIAIDDSESMRESRAGELACEALSLLCVSLSKLEVGQVGVLRFGEGVQVCVNEK